MENETTLPADFNGVFEFTNYTDRDFTTKWNSVEYTFPAQKTVPLIIPSATPEEVQNIRKKFARDLAIEVFYGSAKFKSLDLSVEDSQAGKVPALYSESDIAPFVQKCLEPLEKGTAKAKPVEKVEAATRTDEDGKPVTTVLTGKESLVGQGQVVA